MSRGGVFDIGPFSPGALPPAKRARFDDDRSKGGKGGKFGKGAKGGGKPGKGKFGQPPGPLSVFRPGPPAGGVPKGGKGWDAPRPERRERPRVEEAPEPGPLDEGLVLEIQNFVEERGGGQVEGGQIGAQFHGIKKSQLKPHFDIVDVGGGKYWVRQLGFDGPIPDEIPGAEEKQDALDEPADDLVEDPYLAESFQEEGSWDQPIDDPPADAVAEDDDEYTQSLLRRVEDLQQELADVLAAKGLREEDLPSSKARWRAGAFLQDVLAR